MRWTSPSSPEPLLTPAPGGHDLPPRWPPWPRSHWSTWWRARSSARRRARRARRGARAGGGRRFRRAIPVRRPMEETIQAWRSRWPGIEAPTGEEGRYHFESSDGLLGPLRGTVAFTAAPGTRGTEIRLETESRPPLGPIGIAFSRLSPEEPARKADDQLR